MADVTLPQTERDVSAIMRKVHSTNTAPEVVFRKALDARGIQYQPSANELPGKPDVIMPDQRFAIFIDGDFWHGNQWRRRKLARLEDQFQKSSSRSREYWLKKIRRNMSRDSNATAALLSSSWTVLRFWESDIRSNLEVCIELTLDVLEHGTGRAFYSLLPQRTFAEFFAGIGLMRMGLERQGWSISFTQNDDEQKRQMYQGQFVDTDLQWSLAHIQRLSAETIPTVSLATASFSCSDIPLAGTQQGLDGAPPSAFWGFVRVLDDMGDRKPPLILLECPADYLTSHRGEGFRRAMLALNRLSYEVDAFMLDTASFAPLGEQKLFVVGVLTNRLGAMGSVSEQATDTRALSESGVRPKILTDFIKKRRDIQWSVRDLPDQPVSAMRLEDVLEDFPEDASVWWSAQRAERLLTQMSSRHRELAERMIGSPTWNYAILLRRTRNGRSKAEFSVSSVERRLHTSQDGSFEQILFKAGQGRYFTRLITPREAARLKGADDFTVSVPPDQALYGFNDAVCVPLIEWVAQYYLNPVVNELIRGRALRRFDINK